MLHDGRADVPHLRNLTLRRSIIPENDREFRAYDLTLRRSIIPENDREFRAYDLTLRRSIIPENDIEFRAYTIFYYSENIVYYYYPNDLTT